MTLIACATTSWSSRAIRVRSSSTARRAFSSRSSLEDTLAVAAHADRDPGEERHADEEAEEEEAADVPALTVLVDGKHRRRSEDDAEAKASERPRVCAPTEYAATRTGSTTPMGSLSGASLTAVASMSPPSSSSKVTAAGARTRRSRIAAITSAIGASS